MGILGTQHQPLWSWMSLYYTAYLQLGYKSIDHWEQYGSLGTWVYDTTVEGNQGQRGGFLSIRTPRLPWMS